MAPVGVHGGRGRLEVGVASFSMMTQREARLHHLLLVSDGTGFPAAPPALDPSNPQPNSSQTLAHAMELGWA